MAAQSDTLKRSFSSISTVSVLDFGAFGDGKQDDTLAIQQALDSGAIHVTVPAGTFLVSSALQPHPGQTVEILGTIRLADACVQSLREDVLPGADHCEVEDASCYRVGQWLIFNDTDCRGWNPGETRVRGDCGRIRAIRGNEIQLEGRLNLGYRVKAGARVATHSSVFLVEKTSGVRIVGHGTIDGNKDGQIDARPMTLQGCGVRTVGRIGGDGGEEIRAGCGIAVSGPRASVAGFTVENVTVRDATEHNLCLCGTKNLRVLNTRCLGARDKNITLLDSEDARIAGNIASFSDHEDGIMLHQQTGNSRVLIQGNICEGNPRQGIGVGAEESQVHLQGNLCIDNGLNLFLGGRQCSSTGDSCAGQNYKRFPRENAPQGALFAGEHNRIQNFGISGDRLVLVQVSGREITWHGGQIIAESAQADGCAILVARLSARDPHPQNLNIQGVLVAGACDRLRTEGAGAGIKIDLLESP